jgi:CHAT domain-containing protein
MIHFSCHASTDWHRPEESGLSLAGDDKFRIREIFRLQGSNARLVFLAACETGIPPLVMPNESLSLPLGFLQAGFPGVVSSLWAVEDLSTALLSIRFYQEWLTEGKRPAEALHIAVRWIRDSSNGEICEYLALLSDLMMRMTDVPDTEQEKAISALSRLQSVLIAEPDVYSFEDPYYWAGFILTGV